MKFNQYKLGVSSVSLACDRLVRDPKRLKMNSCLFVWTLLGGQCPFSAFFRTVKNEPQLPLSSIDKLVSLVGKNSSKIFQNSKGLQGISTLQECLQNHQDIVNDLGTLLVLVKRPSPERTDGPSRYKFSFKCKVNNEHVRTGIGETMNIDFLLLMTKKNDGHSAGISTNKAFYVPIVHPMVPIGNLSTTVDQHLGEPGAILGKNWQLLQARGFFHIQFVDSKEEINSEKLASVESSWKSAHSAFSQVFTPPPHSQWNQKGYIDTRPQCAFLSNIWNNQVRCIKPWK